MFSVRYGLNSYVLFRLNVKDSATKHCSNGILLFQGFCCEGLHNILDGHCCAA
jgi:hypothetical protein